MGLKEKTFTGFLWSSAGTIGNGLVNLLVTIVLARILTPEDFAIVALLTVFVTVSNVIVDSGFSQAIIRDDNPSDTDLSSVFYFNLFLSVLLYAILFAVSPRIAEFYNEPKLIPLSRVIFLIIIFNSFVIIQNATLKQSLNFSKVEKSSVFGSILAGIASVIMAFTGYGIWAIVANMVLMPLLRAIFLWIYSDWRPVFKFSFRSIGKYFRFGVFLMLNSVIDMVITNLNTLVIGKFYTKNELGYYSQACKLGTYIVTPLTSVINKVVYPIFAKIKNDMTRLIDGYRQILGILIFVTFPIMLFVICNAKNTMVFFFGEKWESSSVYLQYLSILDLFQIIQYVFMNIVVVKGKTKELLIVTIIRQLLRIITLFFTVRISVEAMVLGFVISSIVGTMMYIGLGMYYLKYKVINIFTDNYKTLFSTGISILLVIFVSCLIEWAVYYKFILQVFLMASAYIFLNILFKNSYIKEVTSLFSSLKKQ